MKKSQSIYCLYFYKLQMQWIHLRCFILIEFNQIYIIIYIYRPIQSGNIIWTFILLIRGLYGLVWLITPAGSLSCGSRVYWRVAESQHSTWPENMSLGLFSVYNRFRISRHSIHICDRPVFHHARLTTDVINIFNTFIYIFYCFLMVLKEKQIFSINIGLMWGFYIN